MFKKRNTVRRRVWHVLSNLLAVAAVVVMIASADKIGNNKTSYMVTAGIMLLVAFAGVMDSLESPCTFCGGAGEIAAGSWTLPCDAMTCSHCHGSGVEPIFIYGTGPGW